jgi:SOS-response transcriptional repressor LexA
VIQSDLSFNENLHRVLYRILEFRKEHQLSIKLFQEEKEMGTPTVQEMLNEVEMAIVSYIKEKIQLAVKKKEIRPCDPDITAFLMLKMYVSFIFDWERNHQPLDKEEIAELLHLYLFKGLSITT